MRTGPIGLSTAGPMVAAMESFMQKLAKKKEPPTVTILPVLNARHTEHAADCGCGEEGCSGSADGGCCGG